MTASTGSGGVGGTTVAGDLPCDVATLLAGKCLSCHGTIVAPGSPMSLVTYANLTAPAKSDPTKTVAVLAISRMTNTDNPMPPTGLPPATPVEIASLQSWVSAGYPRTGCSTTTVTPTDASSRGEAPTFTIAGTIYPTAHEPDLCNGAAGTGGALIVVTDANGNTISITPNSVGNFYY